MPTSTSSQPTPSRRASVTAPSSLVPECPPLMPGQSVEQYTQGLAALRSELGADTPMKAQFASKIYECLWWLNCYDEAKKATIIDGMCALMAILPIRQKDVELIARLKAMDWNNEDLIAAITAKSFTPQSLYAAAIAKTKNSLLILEQLSAIRTKSLHQLQASYEAFIKRPVLLEILRLERDKLARSLTAIDVAPAPTPAA